MEARTTAMAVVMAILLGACAGRSAMIHQDPADQSLPATCEAVILTYHKVRPLRPQDGDNVRENLVTPENFERQMRYMREGYTPVTFGRIVDCVEGGERLPPRAVAVTFDDTEASPFQNAIPLLQRLRIPATFFITTDFIGKPDRLTWQQILMLREAGMTIGAHTLSHPDLTEILDPRRLMTEIFRSKRVLESRVKEPVVYFAYPFGETNSRVIAAVKRAGFRAARGTRSVGYFHGKSDLYDLRSHICSNDNEAFKQALRF